MSKETYSLITKTYAKNIWRRYIKAIEEYKLISDGDRIYVPRDLTAAGRLTYMLLKMTAEFRIYDIEIIEEDCNEEQAMLTVAEACNCNKIALPQDFQDIMDNTLWEMLYNARICSICPKEKSGNITIIRPLYLIHKEHIQQWYDELSSVGNIPETSPPDIEPPSLKESQLAYIRKLLKQLSENNDAVENNVFGSVTNVDADMLLGYNLKGEHHEFLEWY